MKQRIVAKAVLILVNIAFIIFPEAAGTPYHTDKATGWIPVGQGVSEDSRSVRVTGTVSDASNGKPLEFAYVEVRTEEEKLVTAAGTGEKGEYELEIPAPGTFTLRVNYMGYDVLEYKDVRTERGKSYRYDFRLDPASESLDGAIVRERSESQQIARLPYNISTMETARLKNSTLDLSQVIGKMSGVRIRETGGLGSEVNVTLNGFSGKHVKIFIDGVPMEGMNSAFGLNNIPAGMAKRIEVYKGVVPVELGGDALGGAINIITDESRRTRVTASYSYGSFNTHKSNIYAEHTSKKGFYVSFNAYQNYSDNNYKVDVRILDLQTQVYNEGTQRVRRFHGQYHNEAAVFKIGFVDKPFADRLTVGFIGGYEYQQVQNASSMDFVFGQRYNTAGTLTPTLAYRKHFKVMEGMDISLNGNYNFGKSFSADTASRTYNWLGDHIDKMQKGELDYMKYHYRDRNGAANLRLTLHPAKNHTLSLSSTFTSFSRKGHDEADPQESDNYPRNSMKNVSGLGYSYDMKGKFNASAFVKNYLNYLEAYIDPEGGTDYRHYRSTLSYWGAGIAATWFISGNLQLKASYEHSYRLPSSKELFGSGDGIEVGTPTLKPEASDNCNLGFSADILDTGDHTLNASITLQYRNIKDYIRRTTSQTNGTATSTNEGKVRSMGADAEIRYSFRDIFYIGGNFSYFDMRNMARFKPGTTVESTIYKDRVPNQPYMYGNADAGVNIRNLFIRGSLLNIHYMLNYIHRFYFDWPSYNGRSIPSQLTHDILVSYNFGDRHDFTIALEARNILDERLFDNFNLQKPGRSFAVKLTYSFSK